MDYLNYVWYTPIIIKKKKKNYVWCTSNKRKIKMYGHTIFFPTFERPLIKLYVCVYFIKNSGG